MEVTDAKERIVEKKVYEDDKKKEYASKGVAGTGLGLGIAGTALGLLALSNGRGIFGSLGGGVNLPENVNINAYGIGAGSNQPTALQVLEKENNDEVKLLTDMFGLKLDTANKFYQMREVDINEKFSLYKGGVDAINAENRRAMDAEFGLYKTGRDQYDATNAKISALETKIAVMEALAPYKEKILLQAMDLKTAYNIRGQVVLPNTPAVTGYGSYCCCRPTTSTSTTGA